MKPLSVRSRFTLEPTTVLATVLATALTAGLSACSMADVNPEVGTAGGNESNPEVAMRLPSIRLANLSVTSIDALSQDKADKKVAVGGKVVQRSALLDGWLYQVRDDSGSLWILTDDTAPQINEAVVVEGLVRYEPIVVGEIDASDVYLEEQAHRLADE